MDENLDLFLKSCFPTNWGEASWGRETFRVQLMDKEHLERAKSAILAVLEKEIDARSIAAALAVNLTEAAPIMKKRLRKITPDSSREEILIQACLAHGLYILMKDEAYTPMLIDAIRNSGYNDPVEFVTKLGELPLTREGISLIWQKLVKAKTIKSAQIWKDYCLRFLKEKIRLPIGESFLKSLTEEERKELLELISEFDHPQPERKSRLENYIHGRDRYNKDEVNKFGEYIKVGGSPTKGLTLKHIWKGHTGYIKALDWSPDGGYLASTSTSSGMEPEAIRIWDLKTGKCIRELKHPKKDHFDRYEPGDICWVPMGKNYLAVVYYCSIPASPPYYKVSIWDVEAENLKSSLYEMKQIIRLISFPGGKTLSVDDGRSLYLIDVITNAKEQIFTTVSGQIETVAISPNESMLAIGYQKNIYRRDAPHEILLFDIKSKQVTNRIRTEHILQISKLGWMPNQPILAAASADNTISIWDLRENRMVILLEEGHDGVIKSLSFSANGELLASKSEQDQLLQIWRTGTWQTIVTLKEESYSPLVFHPTLPVLASACRTKGADGNLQDSIRIWEFSYKSFLNNPPFWEEFNRQEAEIAKKQARGEITADKGNI